MYNITIHNTQHLCQVENVAKHSVRYNGVLHFDPASLRTIRYATYHILLTICLPQIIPSTKLIQLLCSNLYSKAMPPLSFGQVLVLKFNNFPGRYLRNMVTGE